MSYILLVIGFILLIKGADTFVSGASSIAKIFHVPSLVIGLTIVAFGTSAPEAAVSISAALAGNNDMAIANVVGSNIFNLLCVGGVAAMIHPLAVQKSTILKEFPFAILASLVLIVLAHDVKFQGYPQNLLTRADGLILLALFSIFMYYLFDVAFSSKQIEVEKSSEENISIGKSVLLSIIGIFGIIIGGQIVVNSASDIALSWGMSQNLVGLTIVSIGTSLPEFMTSVIAAKKGESDIAIGNIVGSNLFNILFILGLSAVIHPMAIQTMVFVDMVIMLMVTIVTYSLSATKKTVSKPEGILLAIMYVVYLAFIITRQ